MEHNTQSTRLLAKTATPNHYAPSFDRIEDYYADLTNPSLSPMNPDQTPHHDLPIAEPTSPADDNPRIGLCWLIKKISSSLRLRFILALAILFVAGFLSQLRINNLLTDSIADSAMINSAGRQRMLCERIARHAFEVGALYDQQKWGPMNEAIKGAQLGCEELTESHRRIKAYIDQDDHQKDLLIELKTMLVSIEPQIFAYTEMIDKIALNANKRDRFNLGIKFDALETTESATLKALDEFVGQYALYAWAKVEETRTIGWVMYGLLIWVGLSSMVLVVEPGVRAQRRALERAKENAEQALKAKQELSVYHEATNQASLVMTTDLKGNITYANDAICNITGYSRDELLGSNCKVINSGHHPREFFRDMYTTIGRGDLWHAEVCNRRKDGSLYWIDATIVPILGDSGKIESYYSLRIDITKQKEIERELQTILDALPSMIIYKDENNTLLRVNAAVGNAVGREPRDIAGHQSDEFLAGDNSIDNHEDDLDILAKGTSVMGRIEPVTLPNGDERIMRIDKIPMFDAAVAHNRIVTIATDITETVEMEQRFSLTIEATEAGIWDWDINESKLDVNDCYFTMLGDNTAQSPVNAGYYQSRLHPEDRDRILSQIENSQFTVDDPYNAEFRLRHNDGTYRWIQSRGKITQINPDGTAQRMIGQHLNIDSAKRLELAIRSALELRSKETQVETLQALSTALAMATRSSYACVSRIFEKDGQQWARMVAGTYNGKPLEPFEYLLDGTPCGRAVEIEYSYFPDHVVLEFPEDEMLIEMNMRGYAGTSLTNSSGEIIGILFIMDTDPLDPPFDPRTALKLFGARAMVELENSDTQEELRKAALLAEELNQSKSDFLANMSHEIRTPMTAILGFADLLGENDPDFTPERRLDAVQTIQSNGNHLLTIINDILDLSKIEAGKMTVELMPVQPIEILHQVESLMGERAAGKGLDLNIEFSTDIPETITSDPTRLRQILLNLIGNAIKFTETGSITVRCSLTDDLYPMLNLEVIDTGIGMTKKQCDSIFDAFTQADSSTTRKFGGTGLGLNISSSLAQMLGGSVSVSSKTGKGSCFMVTIDPGNCTNAPLVGIAQYQDALHSTAKTKSKSTSLQLLACKRILLVEDGPDNQKLISHHLRKAGAEVDFANNGRIAVDTLTAPDAPHYDLVLMDMQMPVLDGYKASIELRNHGFTTPIIALTAHAMESDRKKCLDAGCTAYQTKPIDKVALIAECFGQIQSTQNITLAKRDAA